MSFFFIPEEIDRGHRYQRKMMLKLQSSLILALLERIRLTEGWWEKGEWAFCMPSAYVGLSCAMHSHRGGAYSNSLSATVSGQGCRWILFRQRLISVSEAFVLAGRDTAVGSQQHEQPCSVERVEKICATATCHFKRFYLMTELGLELYSHVREWLAYSRSADALMRAVCCWLTQWSSCAQQKCCIVTMPISFLARKAYDLCQADLLRYLCVFPCISAKHTT